MKELNAFQYFLIGLNIYRGVVDGIYGPKTKQAIMEFQRQNGLEVDGQIGQQTLLKAVQMGFKSSEFPFKPINLKPLVSNEERAAIFGSFKYESSHDLTDMDAVDIVGDWEEKNIINVEIPQLSKIKSTPFVRFHRLAAPQLIKLFKDWEDAGLIDRILTWDGAFYPRFVRGSKRVLSNHSFGTAFDINVEWNGLGRTPALVGQKGSVRELIPIANANGFYWGGHFTRQDGMHIEVCKLMN